MPRGKKDKKKKILKYHERKKRRAQNWSVAWKLRDRIVSGLTRWRLSVFKEKSERIQPF